MNPFDIRPNNHTQVIVTLYKDTYFFTGYKMGFSFFRQLPTPVLSGDSESFCTIVRYAASTFELLEYNIDVISCCNITNTEILNKLTSLFKGNGSFYKKIYVFRDPNDRLTTGIAAQILLKSHWSKLTLEAFEEQLKLYSRLPFENKLDGHINFHNYSIIALMEKLSSLSNIGFEKTFMVDIGKEGHKLTEYIYMKSGKIESMSSFLLKDKIWKHSNRRYYPTVRKYINEGKSEYNRYLKKILTVEQAAYDQINYFYSNLFLK